MDWLTFIVALAEALGWPTAVLIIVLILRKPLFGLIPLLQRLKYKDLELDFGRRIEEVRAEAASELPPSARAEALPPPVENRIVQLARISPRSAVLESWLEVEHAVIEAAQRNPVPVPYDTPGSATKTLRVLQRAGIVDPGVVALFNDLRPLRNQAAHAPEFALTQESAIEFAELAQRLALYLRSIGTEPPSGAA